MTTHPMSPPEQIRALTDWLAENKSPFDTMPGRFYMVPCARHTRDGKPMRGHPWWPSDGWLPLLGPVHEDREAIGFEPLHVHVDTRFLPKLPSYWMGSQMALGSPLCLTGSEVFLAKYELEFGMRRRLCRRQPLQWDRPVFLNNLEQAYRGCRVGADGLCPHRKIPLTAGHRLADGTVVCAGHGLRWSQQGALVSVGDS